MCLDSVVREYVIKKDKEVYKVVLVHRDKQDHLRYYPLFNHTGMAFLKGRNEAIVEPVEYYPFTHSNSKGWYASGYHCFGKIEDARFYNLYELAGGCNVIKCVIPAGTRVTAGYTHVINNSKRLYTLVTPVLIMR